MKKKNDWLPKKREELYIQSRMTRTYLDGHFGDFGIDGVSAEWVNSKFKFKQDVFFELYLDWVDSSERTPVKISKLKNAEAEFIAVYRQLYNGFLKNNPNVTDSDLISMGLPMRTENKRTPSPVPSTYPDLTMVPGNLRSVKVSFKDHERTTNGKPQRVKGVLIRWAILPEPPKTIEELKETVFDTRTPHTFTFSDRERGQWLYCVAAWYNSRGELGSWSRIVSTIIP